MIALTVAWLAYPTFSALVVGKPLAGFLVAQWLARKGYLGVDVAEAEAM